MKTGTTKKKKSQSKTSNRRKLLQSESLKTLQLTSYSRVKTECFPPKTRNNTRMFPSIQHYTRGPCQSNKARKRLSSNHRLEKKNCIYLQAA